MIQDEAFIRKWFNSVEKFLKDSSGKEAERFLSYCAEGCSKSYSLAVYQNAFIKGGNLEESLQILAQSFDDFAYKIHPDKIEISYSRCGCDLKREEFMRSDYLCKCSELSLQYNWSSVFGAKNVRVEMIHSIIGGGKKCLFEVRVRQLGHAFDT